MMPKVNSVGYAAGESSDGITHDHVADIPPPSSDDHRISPSFDTSLKLSQSSDKSPSDPMECTEEEYLTFAKTVFQASEDLNTAVQQLLFPTSSCVTSAATAASVLSRAITPQPASITPGALEDMSSPSLPVDAVPGGDRDSCATPTSRSLLVDSALSNDQQQYNSPSAHMDTSVLTTAQSVDHRNVNSNHSLPLAVSSEVAVSDVKETCCVGIADKVEETVVEDNDSVATCVQEPENELGYTDVSPPASDFLESTQEQVSDCLHEHPVDNELAQFSIDIDVGMNDVNEDAVIGSEVMEEAPPSSAVAILDKTSAAVQESKSTEMPIESPVATETAAPKSKRGRRSLTTTSNAEVITAPTATQKPPLHPNPTTTSTRKRARSLDPTPVVVEPLPRRSRQPAVNRRDEVFGSWPTRKQSAASGDWKI